MLKKIIKNKKGSGLILAILITINSLLLIGSIGAVAVIQKKSTGKSRNAVTAYQIADGGIEWAMEISKAASDTDSISGIFGAGEMNTDGSIDCKSTLFSGLNGTAVCKVYFLKQDGSGYEIITDDSKQWDDVKKIRVIGEYGTGENWVRRGVEITK